jgi:hypothetical protein
MADFSFKMSARQEAKSLKYYRGDKLKYKAKMFQI